VACRDRALLVRVLAAKNALSTCIAATSEVLATIALRAEPAIIARTRAIGQRNRERLTVLLDRLPDLFESDASRNLAFAFPRYRDPEGSDRLAMRLLRHAGLHLLPASLWRSPLTMLPTDHVRIGLGHVKHGAGLDALETYLIGNSRSPRPHDALSAMESGSVAEAPEATLPMLHAVGDTPT
jgi:aspartate/methionine/tyrosine aminotransferase